MSTTPARVLLGLVIAGIWLAVLPAVASADDCATRAARIAAGQVPSNEADPDCKKAGVIGTTVAVAAASTAVGVAAVKVGLGGAGGAAKPPVAPPGPAQGGVGGPVVTGMYSGPEAIDILVKSGLAVPVKDASGNPVWETDPRTGQPLRYPNGDPVPRVKPAPGFDNLGGNPVSRVVGQSIDPSGKTDLVQTQTITGVTGFAGGTRPDGTIDPNVAITVDQGRAPKDGFPWTPPVEPPPPATTPPTTTTPQAQQTTTPQTPPTTPPQPPPQTPPQPPPQVTVPVPPQAPPQPPPQPPQTTPQTPPQTAKPPAAPPDISKIPTNDKGERIPQDPDQVAVSVMHPGTTLIDTQTGGFLSPQGTVVNYPGGLPDNIKDLLSKGAKIDTSGGRVTIDVKVNPSGSLGGFLDLPTINAHVQISAQGGKLTATAPNGDLDSKLLTGAGNLWFNSNSGPNGQWANARGPGYDKGLDVRSLTTVTDPATGKTYIKVDVVPRK